MKSNQGLNKGLGGPPKSDAVPKKASDTQADGVAANN